MDRATSTRETRSSEHKDPSIPPKNGHAPLLSLPFELFDEVLTCLLGVGASRQPRVMRQISDKKIYARKPTGILALLLACKTTHAAASRRLSSYNTTWILDPYRAYGLTRHHLRQDPNVPGIRNFLQTMSPEVSLCISDIYGSSEAMAVLLSQLNDPTINIRSVSPGQLSLVGTVDHLQGAQYFTPHGWKSRESYKFWRHALIWLTNPTLKSLEIFLRRSPPEPAGRRGRPKFDWHLRYPREKELLGKYLLFRLPNQFAYGYPPWLERVVDEGVLNFEWHYEVDPPRVKFLRVPGVALFGVAEAREMLRQLDESLGFAVEE